MFYHEDHEDHEAHEEYTGKSMVMSVMRVMVLICTHWTGRMENYPSCRGYLTGLKISKIIIVIQRNHLVRLELSG